VMPEAMMVMTRGSGSCPKEMIDHYHGVNPWKSYV